MLDKIISNGFNNLDKRISNRANKLDKRISNRIISHCCDIWSMVRILYAIIDLTESNPEMTDGNSGEGDGYLAPSQKKLFLLLSTHLPSRPFSSSLDDELSSLPSELLMVIEQPGALNPVPEPYYYKIANDYWEIIVLSINYILSKPNIKLKDFNTSNTPAALLAQVETGEVNFKKDTLVHTFFTTHPVYNLFFSIGTI